MLKSFKNRIAAVSKKQSKVILYDCLETALERFKPDLSENSQRVFSELLHDASNSELSIYK